MGKPTSAQSWLGHSLEGLAVMTAVTTVAVLLPQIQSGSFTWQGVGVATLSAVVTVGSKYGAGVLTNAQTAQAINDTVTQAIESQATPVLPDVIIHNHLPSGTTSTAPTAPVEPQVPQVPQVPQTPAQPQFVPPFSAATSATTTNTYPLAAIQVPPPAQGG